MAPIFPILILSLSFLHYSHQTAQSLRCSGFNSVKVSTSDSSQLTPFPLDWNISYCYSGGYFLESVTNRSLNLTLAAHMESPELKPNHYSFAFLRRFESHNIGSKNWDSCGTKEGSHHEVSCSSSPTANSNLNLFLGTISDEIHRNVFFYELEYQKINEAQYSACSVRVCFFPFIWVLPEKLELYKAESMRSPELLHRDELLNVQKADGTLTFLCRVSNVRLPPTARLEWLINGDPVTNSSDTSTEHFPTRDELVDFIDHLEKGRDFGTTPSRASLAAALSVNLSAIRWNATGAVLLTCRLDYQSEAPGGSFHSRIANGSMSSDIVLKDAGFTIASPVSSSGATVFLSLAMHAVSHEPVSPGSHSTNGPRLTAGGINEFGATQAPLKSPPSRGLLETPLSLSTEDLPLLLIGVICVGALALMMVNVLVVFAIVCKQRKRPRRLSKDQRREHDILTSPAIRRDSLVAPAAGPSEDDPTGLEFGGRLPLTRTPPERSSRRSQSSLLAEHQCRFGGAATNDSRSYVAFDEAIVPSPPSYVTTSAPSDIAQYILQPENRAFSHYVQSQAQPQMRTQFQTQRLPVALQPYPLDSQQPLLRLPSSAISTIYARPVAIPPPQQGTILQLPNALHNCSLESLPFDHLTHVFDKQMERLEEDPLMSCSLRSNSHHQHNFECGDGFRVRDSLPFASTGMLPPTLQQIYANRGSSAASDGARSPSLLNSLERLPEGVRPHSVLELELPSPGVLATLLSQMQCVGQVLVSPPATLALGSASGSSSLAPGAAAHRLYPHCSSQRPEAVALQSLGLRRELLADRCSTSTTPTSNYYQMACLARFSPKSGLPQANSDSETTGANAGSSASATITAFDAV